MTRSVDRLTAALAVVAVVGLAISIYLTWTRLAGVAPICGPSGGCETVESSEYSAVGPIPTAAFGIVFSAVILACAVLVRWGDGRAAYEAYGLGLAGILIEAYLVYLELFVIHAVCLWCAAYGLTILAGLALSVLLVRAGQR